MSPRSAVWTYQDYAALPDDGRRYELHDGELSVTPAPGTRHQRVLRELAELVDAHVKSGGLGEMLFRPGRRDPQRHDRRAAGPRLC